MKTKTFTKAMAEDLVRKSKGVTAYIPNDITELEPGCFSNLYISEVILPEGLTIIGENAFSKLLKIYWEKCF